MPECFKNAQTVTGLKNHMQLINYDTDSTLHSPSPNCDFSFL